MRKSWVLQSAASAVALWAAVVGSAAGAQPGTADPMPMGRVVFAPDGYLDFCARRPGQCGVPELAGRPVDEARRALNTIEWRYILPVASLSQASLPSAQPSPNSISAPRAPSPQIIGAEDLATPVFLEAADAGDQVPDLAPQKAVWAEALSIPSLVVDFDEGPRTPSSPRFRLEGGAEVRADATLLETLAMVNAEINRRIVPAGDVEAFGRYDYWDLPLQPGAGGRGNCKHYVLEKRKRLAELGVPEAALSMAIVRTGWGEVHAVLLVNTDRGELVLDNLKRAIVGWREADYRWMSRQVPGAPLKWRDLERPDPSAAAITVADRGGQTDRPVL